MTTNQSTILWTRSTLDYASDRPLLEPYITKVHHMPCISFRPIELEQSAPIQRDIICTSPHTALFLSQSVLASSLSKYQFHVFGKKTAKALRTINPHLAIITYDASNSKELLNCLPSKKKYTYLGPQSPAHDLETIAKSQEIEVNHMALYDTIEHMNDNDIRKAQDLANSHKLIACFASPSAARSFFHHTRIAGLVAIAIGNTTKTTCEAYFTQTELASEQSLESLLAAAVAMLEGAQIP